MKIDDRLVGLILVALGTAVFLIARTFPLMAGMPYGPGFFPSIAAVGMIVCGLVITVSGALKARAAAPVPASATTDALDGGLLRPFLIGLCVVFFGLTMPILGFHISAIITVAAAAYIFGAGPLTGIVLALAAAFATHAAFYSLLRVPLSWGLLTPYAW